MIARIFLSILGVAVLREMFQPKKVGIGLRKDDIDDSLLIRLKRTDKERVVKQRITKNLQKLIGNCKSFKIGKTGLGDTRGYNYQDYDQIFRLCISLNSSNIDELERYYNDKFFNHPKNNNQRKGSAGQMSKSGEYYLYVVIRW